MQRLDKNECNDVLWFLLVLLFFSHNTLVQHVYKLDVFDSRHLRFGFNTVAFNIKWKNVKTIKKSHSTTENYSNSKEPYWEKTLFSYMYMRTTKSLIVQGVGDI